MKRSLIQKLMHELMWGAEGREGEQREMHTSTPWPVK